MGAYCHKRSFPLRYTDFDFRDRLKISTLLSLAQESAASSADELGFGYEALKQKNYGFITVNTDCILLSPAKLGDTLTVETWPLPPRHVIFERDYRISNQMGEIIALLASRWCLIDLPRFVMLPPTALGAVNDRCPYNSEKLFEPKWKIERAEGGREVYRTAVRQSLCDHYLHANNAKYADFFMDCFTMKELASRPIKAFQIAYIKQAKEGETLELFREDREGESICEAREGGEPIAQFRVWFAEAKK